MDMGVGNSEGTVTFGRIIGGIGLFIALLPASCGQTGQGDKNPSGAKTAGTETTLAIPLDAAQASALQGVVGDAAVDIYLNEQLIAEGLKGGIRGGRRGGIRGASSTPQGAARRQSTGEWLVAFEVTFLMPAQLASEGSMDLRTVVRSTTQTNLAFVEVKTTVQLRSTPGGTSVEVVEQSLNSNQVAWPDLDGDGVSTLNEVVAAGVNAALDGATKPTDQEIQQALASLGVKLEQVLKEQGITATITVADLDKTSPDTGATCPLAATAEREVSILFTSTENGSTFLCQLDTSTPVPCASPFAQNNLSAGAHVFTVQATDPAGNVDPSPAACTWTITLPLPPKLPAPTGLNLSPGNASATFSWTVVSGAKSYQVYYGTASGSRSNPVTSTNTSLTVTGLYNGTRYYFSVAAVDAEGIEGVISAEVSTTPSVPPPPSSTAPSSPSETTPPTFTGLGSASAVSTSQINLAWTAATDNETAASGIVYKICRSTTSGACQTSFTATYATAAGATSYSVTGLNASTAYSFVVRAQDAAGNTDANTVQKAATTLSSDTTPPSFAGLSSATAVSAGQIDLTWNAAIDSVSPGSSIVYEICQSTIPRACVSIFSSSQVTTGGATTFSVTGLAGATRYSFVVRARDQAGNVDANLVEKSASTYSPRIMKSLSGAAYHMCALTADGTVHCWGRNSQGQLGDGTSIDRYTAVAVSTLTAAMAISAGGDGGENHTCALLADGTARCWGRNLYSQLGDWSSTSTFAPVAVVSLTSATAISAGGRHTCALIADGTARCWGYNFSGQLGDGTSFSRSTPVAVSSLTGAKDIAAGGDHSCALLSDGSVQCWGGGGSLGDGSTTSKTFPVGVSTLTSAVAISSAEAHTCTLISDGSVRCWGGNSNGQLGDGTTVDRVAPVAVSSLTNAVAVATSEWHSCALLSDGTARCWGDNNGGELGENLTCGASCPTPVTVSSLTGAVALAGGLQLSCALIADGTSRCWGSNLYGQIGDGTTVVRSIPVDVSFPPGPVGVVSPNLREAVRPSGISPRRDSLGLGYGLTCALLTDRRVKCWGNNAQGQLGTGSNAGLESCLSSSCSTIPQVVTSLTNVSALADASAYICALLSNGTAKCWGRNMYGGVGDGTTVDRYAPVAVTGLAGAVALTMGFEHTCALLFDGRVQCWGSNSNGQIGNGTGGSGSTRLTPVYVSSLTSAVSIQAGNYHTCALISDGSSKCWGGNYGGSLGEGTQTDRYTPVAVSTLTGATFLAAGGNQTCARVSSGAVFCWGRNNTGQVGDGTTTDRLTPVAITGVQGATEITGAVFHTCAVLGDGSVKCWGQNSNGELGDGTTQNKTTPSTVTSLSGVISLGTGTNTTHTCALAADGRLFCWGGYNFYGEIGDGTTTQRIVPTLVNHLP